MVLHLLFYYQLISNIDVNLYSRNNKHSTRILNFIYIVRRFCAILHQADSQTIKFHAKFDIKTLYDRITFCHAGTQL